MISFTRFAGSLTLAALATLGGTLTASAGTFVYVSNADDGDISTFAMQADGSLQPGSRVKVAATVMPMVVSHDK